VKARVLLVDDDQSFRETLEIGLKRRGYEIVARASAEDARAIVNTEDFDVVVTDLNMKKVSGIDLCKLVVGDRPDIPVVVLTGFGSLDTAVAAIRAGAYDFISKPVELDALTIAIDRATRHRRLGAEVKRLRVEIDQAKGRTGDEMIGQSPAMLEVRDLVERVADSEASVLITGESGSGKEVVARLLHKTSRRATGRFIAINCAAMPESLLESELFGHAKGAFTDAKSDKLGLFAEARGGTLFLDEIGDMPLGIQPKLLRVLQERTVRPVGGTSEVPIDVRVLTATNQDLESGIENGRFREDLYYRINVVELRLPPLRSRRGDILALARHFVERFAAQSQKKVTGLAPAAAERLLDYPWPGNVRELQNCMERAVALARFDQIGVDDLAPKVREHQRASHVLVATDDPSDLVPMDEVERRYVIRVMEAVGGNKAAAARILGFDRKRLTRMLERLGIGREPAT
jgi:DNA-binding NtrC family response regulator